MFRGRRPRGVSPSIRIGKCKKPKGVYVDNEDSLRGQWYIQKRYDKRWAIGEICNFVQMTFDKDGLGDSRLKLNSTGYKNRRGSYSSAAIYARQRNATEATFKLYFDILNRISRNTRKLYVYHLEDKFALTYSCVASGILKFEQAWILSRDQIPRRRTREMKRLEELMRETYAIDMRLKDVRQRDCNPVEIAIEPVKIIGEVWDQIIKNEAKCDFEC